MSILFKFSFVFVGLITPLLSVSAPPFPFEVQQSDGTMIPVRMYGHEYYNWMETEDGYVIDWVEDNDRLGWYYSDLDSEGKFYPTNILVKYPAPDYLDIPKNLQEISPKILEFGHYNLHSNMNQNTGLNRSASTSIIKPLIFLVEFENLPSYPFPNREYNKDQFQHLLFDENLDSDDANLPSSYDMSVRDYYAEISNDNLEVSGDELSIIDWTTADHDYSYYVDGAKGTGGGPNGIARSAAALVVEIAMENHNEIDFSDFDGNNDGDVDLVILIVEGWGNGDDDQFWPHMSLIMPGSNGLESIDPSAPTNSVGYFSLDDVAIKKYIVIPEQFHMNYYDVERNWIHPIGTICHEMGHVLGLPDLYDTSENSAPGIDVWGLMGSGNWQRQTSPAYMSAWSRYRLGFTHPIILENVSNMEMNILPAEGLDVGAAYILPMSSNLPKEYLIIENRQKIPGSSDFYLKKSGLLVWHIDETIIDMYPVINSVNVNPTFYGVNLLQADGDGDLYTFSGAADSGDPFPGSSSNTQITNYSNPNSHLYTYDRDADGFSDRGGVSNISLINISENSDNSISLTAYNPNQKGVVLAYDEGGYEGGAFPEYSWLKWAGIRVVASDTALFSGISTVFPPSYSSWNVTDYTINIWRGWSGNKPTTLLYSLNGDVQWSPEDMRDGGWAYISFIDDSLIWNRGETYYVEINYDGSGGVYPLEIGSYSNSQADGMSYFRGNTTNDCDLLTEIINGDWNIRISLNPDFGDQNNVETNDCAGVLNGDNTVDNCGTCDNNIFNDCIQDCAGIWGGDLIDDICGVCEGASTDSSDCVTECPIALELGCDNTCHPAGTQPIDDDCGICDGDNTVCVGCDGIPNSGSEIDECGVCGGEGAIYTCGCCECSDVDVCAICNGPGDMYECGCQDRADFACDCDGNVEDCAGECGGSAVVDECDICGGDNDDGNGECDVVCDATGDNLNKYGLDCSGECDGDDTSCLSILSTFIPDQFSLFQNYPNPFNSATHIRYDISEYSKVLLRIYDIIGKEISVLYNGYRGPGQYTTIWDASKFATGLYILEINVTSGNKYIIFRDNKKILHIK